PHRSGLALAGVEEVQDVEQHRAGDGQAAQVGPLEDEAEGEVDRIGLSKDRDLSSASNHTHPHERFLVGAAELLDVPLDSEIAVAPVAELYAQSAILFVQCAAVLGELRLLIAHDQA